MQPKSRDRPDVLIMDGHSSHTKKPAIDLQSKGKQCGAHDNILVRWTTYIYTTPCMGLHGPLEQHYFSHFLPYYVKIFLFPVEHLSHCGRCILSAINCFEIVLTFALIVKAA